MAAHADSRPLATVAALYVISAVAYARLPPATVNRAFIAFLLPTAAGAISVLLRRGLLDRTGPLVPRLAPVLLGAALMAIGNLLPRVRPNVAIGIRTSRTLRDRGAW